MEVINKLQYMLIDQQQSESLVQLLWRKQMRLGSRPSGGSYICVK